MLGQGGDGHAAGLLGHGEGGVALGIALGGRQNGQAGALAVGGYLVVVVDVDDGALRAGDDGGLAAVELVLLGLPGVGQVVVVQDALLIELGIELQLLLGLIGNRGVDVGAVFLLKPGGSQTEGLVKGVVDLGQIAGNGPNGLIALGLELLVE